MQAGLTDNVLELITHPDFNESQANEILWGFEQNNLSQEQVEIYAKPIFSSKQMTQIRKGLQNNLPKEDIERYAQKEFTAEQMLQIRLALPILSDKQKNVIINPEIPAYKMADMTARYFQSYESEELAQAQTADRQKEVYTLK